jgi:uncharacterized membrane protein YjgN (DUF898 family)
MEAKLEFTGTGGELFGKLIVGALLTMLTLGIYTPWFMVSFNQYLYSKTRIIGTRRGDIQLEFTGTGGELFKVGLIGLLLTALTLGIYGPWFLVNLVKFYEDNSTGRAADGTHFALRSTMTGGELFKATFVGYLLTVLTLGIYGAWFICSLYRLYSEKTELLENGQAVGKLDFVGQGGDLFVTLLVGNLLTMLTFGIYAPWMQVKLMKFYAINSRVSIHGQVYSGDFLGTGGDYFIINLVGGLLTSLTLGIYLFWYMANLFRFQFNNTVYRVAMVQTR